MPPVPVQARRMASAAALILVVLLAFAGSARAACVNGSAGATSTFSPTNAEQCYVVPAGVTSLQVTVTGGHGKNATGGQGFGATANGTITVTPGQTLYVEVGGDGDFSSFGGGGKFFGTNTSGGGASDVRTCALASCPLTGDPLTDPRLIVAGGGGGVGQRANSPNPPGGEGGNASQNGGAGTTGGGATGGAGGGGGTQSAGGAGGGTSTGGSAGQGGSACPTQSCGASGGGGGGGWFGGGGGGDGTGLPTAGGGGGAGSSYGPALTTFGTATGSGSVLITAPATTAIYSGDGTANDANNTFNGAWNGTAAYTADRAGTASSAFDFSGANYVAAPVGAAAFGTNDWTISMWVKTTASGTIQALTTRDACFTSAGLEVFMFSGQPRVTLYDGGGQKNIIGGASINNGAWHQITVVRGDSVYALAVDGIRVNTAAASGAMTVGTDLKIASGGCENGGGRSKYSGAMDDVRLVNGAAAPVVTTAASISGTQTIGQQLTGNAAFMSGTPTYRWDRCDSSGNACTTTVGTSSAYTLTDDDSGSILRFTATVTNAAGSQSTSAKTNVIPGTPPTVATPATVAGSPAVGQTLTGSASFTGATSTSYRWERCDDAGANCTTQIATTATYVPAPSDVGHQLKFTATGTKGAYATPTSATTAVIDAVLTTRYAAEGDATDTGGNFDGAWVGNEQYGTDRTGQGNAAFAFDGSSAVSGPPGTGRFANHDWTMSLWLKRDREDGWFDLAGTREACAYIGTELRLIEGVPWIEMFGNGTPYAATGVDRVDDGTWHLITGSLDGNDVLRMAVDGVVVGTRQASGTLTPGGAFGIGGLGCSNGRGSDGTLPFDGLIDDVMLVDGAAGALITTAAAVSGTPGLGQQLTGSAIFTSGTPSFLWQRCDASATTCSTVVGTSADYTPVAADLGAVLRFTARVTDATGVRSTSADVVMPANGAPSSGGDRTAAVPAGTNRLISVTPTLTDPTGGAPTVARITSIPANFTVTRADGSAVPAGGDVPVTSGALELKVLAADPADGAIGYRLIDNLDTTLRSTESLIAVDVTPMLSIDSGPVAGSSSTDTRATFGFSGAGSAGSYTCALDSATAGACSPPYAYNDLPVGAHSVTITAVDVDGDTNVKTRSWTVTAPPAPPAPVEKTPAPVETPKPLAAGPTIIGGPSAETGGRDATIEFEVNPGSVAQCSLDGAQLTWCASPMTYRDLDLGKHYFIVRQVDANGVASDISVRKWRIDVAFKPGDDGSNTKAVKGVVNPQVAPSGDDAVGVGCQLNRGSLQQCEVNAYVAKTSLRKQDRKRSAARQTGDAILVGTGKVVLTERGQTSAVVDVKLNSEGLRLSRLYPAGLPLILDVTAKPFDTTQELQTVKQSTLHPPQMLIVPSNGMFSGDSFALSDYVKAWVKAVGKMLDGAVRVRCEGYSDTSGPEKRSKYLSYMRAKAVCDALENEGVGGRIGAAGLGSDRPRGNNGTKSGRKLNRRVEIRVWF